MPSSPANGTAWDCAHNKTGALPASRVALDICLRKSRREFIGSRSVVILSYKSGWQTDFLARLAPEAAKWARGDIRGSSANHQPGKKGTVRVERIAKLFQSEHNVMTKMYSFGVRYLIAIVLSNS